MTNKTISKKKLTVNKAPAKRVLTKKRPVTKVISEKKVINRTFSEKTKTYNHLFIIFSVAGVLAVALLFLLVRINFYYDGVDKSLQQQVNLTEEAFVNKLPMAEKAVDPTVSLLETNNNQPFWTHGDASLGNRRSPIRIFYFADYSSQLSRQQEKILKELFASYPDQIFLVRKDFPSENVISLQGARAARCAGEQGDFWTYHDRLISYLNRDDKAVQDAIYDVEAPSKQNQLQESRSFLVDVAEIVGLNREKFDICMADPGSSIITSNISEGDNLGISTIPTIYFNGQKFSGLLTYEDLDRLVKVVLAK